MALLQVCFGGRIAEQLFCDDISSGAQTDIEQATRIVRQMVRTWGMSENLGPISYGNDQTGQDVAFLMPNEREYSDKTATEIDAEIKHIMEKAYGMAKTLIEANKDRLERIARALLKYETLDADDVKLILDGGQLDKPTVGDLLAAEQAKQPDDGENEKKKQEQSVGG
jgi:cell division protease FtsH